MTDASQDSGANATPVAAAADALVKYLLERRAQERREARWKRLKRSFLAASAVAGALLYLKAMLPLGDGTGLAALLARRTVAVIPIHGTIDTGTRASANTIVPLIERACADGKVKAIILDIDSGGGSPVEADRIITALGQCDTAAGQHKPTHALIGALGASAAYMIAMHADTISASRYSIVGSVGAIIRQLDASAAGQRIGVIERTIRSGPLKGGATLLSPPDAGDAAMLTTIVKDMGQRFIQDAIEARGERLHADAKELATGRVWTASDALKLGLIDDYAVMEDMAQRYKDCTFTTYSTAPQLAQVMGLDSLARELAADLTRLRLE